MDISPTIDPAPAAPATNLDKAKAVGSILCFDFLENISVEKVRRAMRAGFTEFTMNPYSTGNYIQHLLAPRHDRRQGAVRTFVVLNDP